MGDGALSLSAQVIAELVAAGLDGEALVDACRRIEASQASLNDAQVTPGALRQRRYIAKQKASQNVTNDVSDVTTKESPVVVDKTTSPQSTDKPTSSSTPPTRHQRRVTHGTRWPDDFVPKPAPLEHWRANSGCGDAEYWEELQQTGDFWRQRPGSKGLSLNWDLVWLNRVKDLCKQKRERRNARTPTHSKPASISERLAGFAAKLEGDGESWDSGDGEDAAGVPRLRQSA